MIRNALFEMFPTKVMVFIQNRIVVHVHSDEHKVSNKRQKKKKKKKRKKGKKKKNIEED